MFLRSKEKPKRNKRNRVVHSPTTLDPDPPEPSVIVRELAIGGERDSRSEGAEGDEAF